MGPRLQANEPIVLIPSAEAIMSVQHKDYLIETIETSPGRWRARVRRADGRKIKILTTENEAESIPTGGMESFSAEDAVAVAKK